MTQHRAARVQAGPTTARRIASAIARQGAIRIRTGQDVVASWCDGRPPLRERVHGTELVRAVVKFSDAGGNHDAFRVEPWASTDAIARVDDRLIARGRGAEIRSPGSLTRTYRIGELPAERIGATKATEISAQPAPLARQEEGHCGSRRLRRLRQAECALQQRSHDQYRCLDSYFHAE